MHKAVGMSNLDLMAPLKDQDQAEVLAVVASVRHTPHYSAATS